MYLCNESLNIDKMSTLIIEYGIKSEFVSRLFEFLSKIAGAKVKRTYTATEEEIEELKQSKASGICTTDIYELQRKLKAKYANI